VRRCGNGGPSGARRRSRPVYTGAAERGERACYNAALAMVRGSWLGLVVGTALGIISLTADLLGLGGFPGFGWKQAIGTAVAALLVFTCAWRILRRSGRDR